MVNPRHTVALRDVFKRAFERRGRAPFIEGNHVEVLIDGGPFFRRFIDAVKQAERYVYIESYIVSADTTGWRVAKALAERAREGVEIAFCIDGYGSLTLEAGYLDFLRGAGVKVLLFRPLSLTKRRWPWRKRNHRKIVVVDGRIGIVGGMNISDDYASIEDGGRGWRDTAVSVEGPAVAILESMFRRVWAKNGGADLESVYRSTRPDPDGEAVRFLANFGRRDRAFIRRAYLLAIIGAESTVRIMNAYFIPDRVLVRALIRAAKRGVRVELILAGATDVKSALYASRALYSKLLKNGIHVYEWSERVLHAKTAVIDGMWATIGSSNLDYLSSFRNLEVNAGIIGERIGRDMEHQFERDRSRSKEIELEVWKRRPLWMKLVEWFFSIVLKRIF